MSEVLRVDLGRVGRASVLQLIEAQALSGRLLVEVGGVEAGWADFVDGRAVAACLGAVSGVDALYDLVLIDAHRLRFVAFDDGRAPEATPPLADGLSLVMEGCRLRDEFVRLAEHAVTLPGEAPADLSAEARDALAHLDGSCSLAEAIARAGVSPSRVVDELRGLLDAGIVVQVPTSPPMHRSIEGFHEVLESGRRHFHSGDLDRAEADFLAALAECPDHGVARQNLRRVREVRARTWIERVPNRGSER